MKTENVCVSFGENCLTDDILKRHNLKSYSTPYSSSRSNIEYILQIEEDCFSDFLNPEYIEFQYLDNKLVPRLTKYNDAENVYEASCMKGFEFTHHDIINNQNHYDAFKRRCLRLLNLENKNVYIFYHHRYCEETDIEKLLEDLGKLKDIYKNRCRKIEIVMFTQNIVKEKFERKLAYTHKKCIHIYTFYTLNVWGGADRNMLWAWYDDDLIRKMIKDVMKKFSLGLYASIYWKLIKPFAKLIDKVKTVDNIN